MPSAWQKFDCAGSQQRWRYLDDGRIEIEGEGTPVWPQWTPEVNSWHADIMAAAAKHDVAPEYIAAIMALESRGENVCLKKGGGYCYDTPCDCRTDEGCGLMMLLEMSASTLAKRKVSCHEMMSNPPLSIDLGAQGLRYHLDRYNGDFVKAAVAYNAGSVRCGKGKTFGSGPKETCPDPRGWGVVTGCVYSSKSYGDRCAPSKSGYKAYVCTSEYPRTAIRFHNAALIHFLGQEPPQPPPPEPPAPSEPETSWLLVGSTLVGAAAASYLLYSYLRGA